ncbi:Uncharacterised protein [Legionella waltersii]|nr:Uncharacterised protein [Legionella waltersii]
MSNILKIKNQFHASMSNRETLFSGFLDLTSKILITSQSNT